MTKYLAASAAALSLAVAPVAVSAADRAAAPVAADNELGGGIGLGLVALGVLAAFVAITIVTNDEGDDPVSP